MITYADNRLKDEVRNIWKISFPDDSDDFINFYFSKKYKNENTLVYLDNNKAVACFQMLAYDFTFFGHRLPSAYISGAATLPSYQNRGIMTKLLTAAFLEMQKNNVPLTTLIPQEEWLIKFYERIGYNNAFVYTTEKITLDKTYAVSTDYKTKPLTDKEKTYAYYASYLAKQNLCVQKSKEDFDAILTFYEIEKGQIVVVEANNQIKGLCFINEWNNKIIVKDFIYDDLEAKHSLFNYLFIKFSLREIEVIRLCRKKENGITKGMARIINPDLFLDIYAKAHPNINFHFTLIDQQIPTNNKHYLIHNGQCHPTTTASNIVIDINLLSGLLLGYKTEELSSLYSVFPTYCPYMSLMLD
ncbi:MAG TPA: GNAT family N-acetyltransferase [Bacteroidales bacterium]|nr:GNAT family N-acetyltransferase [Bacteroidales bacterium]HOR82556.1 GNAT family N-acetyltransferase [Bacteroidales bacterium]HPJ90998.1 GNAT family N-acetyltransferase [Bacteroidales bacterium]